MASFNLPEYERKPGPIGVPVGGTEMKVVNDQDNEVPRGEPGEIVVRGPFVMSGCWNREEATGGVMGGGFAFTRAPSRSSTRMGISSSSIATRT